MLFTLSQYILHDFRRGIMVIGTCFIAIGSGPKKS